MNDWQRLYVLTKDVTPEALLTMGRLREALAEGSITADQAGDALRDGWESIDELLEAAETPAPASRTEFEESFSPFGRLIEGI